MTSERIERAVRGQEGDAQPGRAPAKRRSKPIELVEEVPEQAVQPPFTLPQYTLPQFTPVQSAARQNGSHDPLREDPPRGNASEGPRRQNVQAGRGIRRIALGVIIVYLTVLTGGAVYRSALRRQSVLELSSAGGAETPAAFIAASEDGSSLQLDTFHRVEMRDGRMSWEVVAQRARYLAMEGITFLTEAKVLAYRPKDPPVRITADTGKIFFEDGVPAKTELAGNIKISSQNSLTFQTDLAIYDIASKRISSPKPVTISGRNMLVSGERMEYDLEAEVVDLRGGVESEFEQSGGAGPTTKKGAPGIASLGGISRDSLEKGSGEEASDQKAGDQKDSDQKDSMSSGARSASKRAGAKRGKIGKTDSLPSFGKSG